MTSVVDVVDDTSGTEFLSDMFKLGLVSMDEFASDDTVNEVLDIESVTESNSELLRDSPIVDVVLDIASNGVLEGNGLRLLVQLLTSSSQMELKLHQVQPGFITSGWFQHFWSWVL